MANAFFSDLFRRFPNAAARCCAGASRRRQGRCLRAARALRGACCPAAAKLPAPRWPAKCSTAITSSTPAAARLLRELARHYGPDHERLTQAIEAWRDEPSDADASDLHFASEPRRQELFRRLNRAPGGTGELVQMRADLLDLLKGRGELAALDRDVRHLLSSWFNRGFLVLRRIDWGTPATFWNRSSATSGARNPRLERSAPPHRSADRRCYAFFHPAMPDAPLIFVEWR
jgi:malonyl-CoA decarboxylase